MNGFQKWLLHVTTINLVLKLLSDYKYWSESDNETISLSVSLSQDALTAFHAPEELSRSTGTQAAVTSRV